MFRLFPTELYMSKDQANIAAEYEQDVFQNLRFYVEPWGNMWCVSTYNEDGKLKGYL